MTLPNPIMILQVKYTSTISDTCPFRLTNVQFWIRTLHSPTMTIPFPGIAHATFTTLTFTNQKKWHPG
jgi:hypothetical protein